MLYRHSYMLVVVCYMLVVVCYMLVVVCYMLVVACYAGCRLLYAGCRLLYIHPSRSSASNTFIGDKTSGATELPEENTYIFIRNVQITKPRRKIITDDNLAN